MNSSCRCRVGRKSCAFVQFKMTDLNLLFMLLVKFPWRSTSFASEAFQVKASNLRKTFFFFLKNIFNNSFSFPARNCYEKMWTENPRALVGAFISRLLTFFNQARTKISNFFLPFPRVAQNLNKQLESLFAATCTEAFEKLFSSYPAFHKFRRFQTKNEHVGSQV